MAGMPIWYELMTADPARVAPFYNAVLGWTIPAEGHPMPNGAEYRAIARADSGSAGGVLTLTRAMQDHGARPCWVTYFDVADVDATVEQASAMGGHALMPAMSMDGIGRMAMLADPEGAPFYVMRPTPPANNPDAVSDVFEGDTAGHCAWNELNTDEAGEQLQFYTSLFDWKVAGEMPMPGDHTYRFLECGERGIGAIGSMKPEGFANAWLPYFRAVDIDAASAAAGAAGARVLWGPHEVPGEDHIIVVIDPAGAQVGIVGKKKG